MSVLGPSVIKQHLQYLTDDDDDAGDVAPEPIKVLMLNLSINAFVMSRIDYCISLLLAGAPRSMTDKLQRVMNAAARIISNTLKFDHGLTQLRHDVLHWLDVADRITFRLCVYVFLCLRCMAPSYLSELCPNCAGLFRSLKDVVICGHRAAVNSSYLVTVWQP